MTNITKNKQIYIDVLLPEYNLMPLTYLWLDDEVELGEIVAVNFRNKDKFGMVLSKKTQCDLDPNKLKNATNLQQKILISAKQRKFIELASHYNIGSLSNFFKMVLPLKTIVLDKILHRQEISAFNVANLSKDQQVAYERLNQYINNSVFSTNILDGVTGSGKTEVFFKSIADKLQQNDENQVLILLPEIALTKQVIDKFEQRFNFMPIIWHSAISPAKKNKAWHNIYQGNARVVIGARSALFLPYNKLSLIVVDEEHDSSFKQEEGTVYNARDMAVLRAYIENIPIILSTATPAIETFFNISCGKYNHILMGTRFNDKPRTDIITVDLKQEDMSRNEWISPKLTKLIEQTITDGKQVLLFLNRRGYAPLTLCTKCGYRFCCKNCSTWMVEHRSKKKLICHHCGFISAIPKICPECSNDDLYACGPGIERIEEEVSNKIKEAKIITLTKENMRTPQEVSTNIDKILFKEINIIIGTQLLTKGHHFPDLALVGVIDADLGLKGGDLRAAEKTYQILEQVSGRAGRENTKGLAVLQTYYPNNQIITALKNNDRKSFYHYELKTRKASFMPPFSRLTAIIISSNKENLAQKIADDLVRIAPLHNKINILGPVESSLFKLKRKHRYRILLQYHKNFSITKYIKIWLQQYKIPSNVLVKVDVDPYNFS